MLSRNGAAGLICLVASLIFLWSTQNIPPPILVDIGASFYPRLVLGALAFCSALLVIFDVIAQWRHRAGAPAGRTQVTTSEAEQPGQPNYKLVLAVFVLFGAYIIFIPLLGFRLSTFLFLTGTQASLSWPRSVKQWLIVLIIAIAITWACYFVFENFLTVLLPRGAWTGFG